MQWSVPYGLEFVLRASMSGRIRRVESPSHPIAVTIDGQQAEVQLAMPTTALDRDVVVLIDAGAVHQPLLRIEQDEAGAFAAAVSVTPMLDTREAPAEVVFLVDRSGSMDGSSIAEVRNALQLCLRSLTAGCAFNIVGFGTTYVTLFPQSRPYDESSLAEASKHVNAMRASMGGTELLPPLEYVLAQPPMAGLPRRVVILTDGDVTNVEQVMAAVAGQHDARVFTFGIGEGPSAALIRGVARVGRGEAEFIRPGERIEAKVMRQFARLLADGVDDVQVDWGLLKPSVRTGGANVVFAGTRLVRYALLPDVVATQITISARCGDRTQQWTVPVDQHVPVRGRDLGTLAAHARIRELEDAPATLRSRGSRQVGRIAESGRADVQRLAMQYGLLSRETSFVAIERRSDAVPGEVELRRIPVALRAGWGGLRDLPVARASMASGMVQGVNAMWNALSSGDAVAAPAFLRRSLSGPGRVDRSSKLSLGSATRPLDALIALQAADGRWPDLIVVAAAVLEPGFDDLEGVQRQLGDAFDDAAFATTLALVWLARRAQAEQVEWARLAAKAEAWLAAHTSEEQRKALLRAAEQLVR